MLKSFSRVVLIALVALFFHAQPVSADWQGNLRMTGRAAEGGKGQIFYKAKRMRMDLEMKGQKMSTLVDATSGPGKAVMLMHSQKMMMEVERDPTKHGVMCDAKDLNGCMAKNGFKKVRNESMLGHPCEVFEKASGKSVQRIWRPTDLVDVFMIKMESGEPGKPGAGMEITDIKIAALSDDVFKIPPGYNKMPNFQNMMKGFDPSAMRKGGR